MSYPYPQDRHRDRKEEGEQPYKDAAEAFSQKEAELDREAGADDPQRDDRSPEERRTDLEREAERRLDQVGDELRKNDDS